MSMSLRKALWSGVMLLMTAATAIAQNAGCMPMQVVSPPTPTGSGQPVVNAPFRVCTSTATGTPCSPLYTPIYYDPALSSSQPNPSTTDGNGNLNVCMAPGNYLVQVSASTIPTAPVTYSYFITIVNGVAPTLVVLLNPAGTQTITQSGGPLAIVGNATVSGTLGVTGAISGPGTGLTGTASGLNIGGNATTATTATTATSVAGGVTGSIPYQSAPGTTSMLLPNTATTDKVLVSHGTGSAGQVPTLTDSPALSVVNMTGLPISPAHTVYTNGSGTYNTPAGATMLHVRMCGAGGGGGGGGTYADSGVTPAATTFGASLLTANGGGGSTAGSIQGAVGGTASGGTINITGAIGAVVLSQYYQGTSKTYQLGGCGASSQFAGSGCGSLNNAGTDAGYCAGGGGGSPVVSGSETTPATSGAGSGGYLEAWIASPSSTYAYSVAAGGSAGTAGTLGTAGGAGGNGLIIVEAY